MKVRAKSLGYFGHKRRYSGDEFVLAKEQEFSHKWMLPLGWEPKGYKPEEVDQRVIETVARASDPVNEPIETPVQKDAAGVPYAPVVNPEGEAPVEDPKPKDNFAVAPEEVGSAEGVLNEKVVDQSTEEVI